MITLIAIAVGIATAWVLFKVFFDNLAELLECVRFRLTPDILSAFRGDWSEDQWAALKLSIYFAAPIGSGFATHYSLSRLFS